MQLFLARNPHARRASDGARVPLAPRDAALLAWLALQGPTARQRLAALLWPHSSPEAARNSLRQRLFHLKKALGDEPVWGQATLRLADGVAHDLDAAETLLAEAELPPDGELADWLARQREHRAQRAGQALRAQADAAEAAADWPRALELAQALLAQEPWSEAAHRRLMRLHYLAGDRAAALLAFDRCEQVLKDEVGTTPSAETLALLRSLEGALVPPVAALPASARALPLSLRRPPRLVGRQREAAALVHALGRRESVLLVGEAGMGKSRLLEELRSAATGQGLPWLLAQARPGDAAVPFATATRLLRELARQQPELFAPAGPRRELARLLPELSPAGQAHRPDHDGAALLAALRGLWVAAAPRLQALVLDDVHFIDPASAELLREVLGGPELAAPLLPCVLATRPQPSQAAQALCEAVVAAGRGLVLPVPALDEAALAELLRSLDLPGVDAAAWAPALLARSGGNPLFLLETLKHAWDDAGGLADAAGLRSARPASVAQLIAERLRQLSTEALALARLAALAGPDFDIALAEALLHTPALRLADAWGELEQAQVLRGAQFAHDLVYETVLASVPQAIARHSHRSLAQWLAQHGAPPERVAGHWLAAGDPARACGPLMQAGQRAVERSLLAQARSLFEQAVEAARAAGQREHEFEALQALCGVYVQSDPGPAHDEATARLAALAQSPGERLWARACHLNRLRRRLTTVDAGELAADLEAAEAWGDDALLAELAAVAVAMALTQGQVDHALALTQRHQALLARGGDALSRAERHGNLAVLLANQDRLPEADAQVMRALAVALEGAEWNEAMTLRVNRLRVLRVQGRSMALDWLAEIDREHAVHAANPRAWVQSRYAACETWRDAGRPGAALQALNQERVRVPTLAGVQAAAWDCAEVQLCLDLGQHARAVVAAQRLVGLDALAAVPAWLQARALQARAQVQARVAGRGAADVPDAEAWALLDAAEARAPRQSRRYVWLDIVLLRAAWSAAADGAALAETVASTAAGHGFVGLARRAAWLACERQLDAGRLDAARRSAEAARQRGQHRFDAAAAAAEPVLATGASPLWAEGVALRLARAEGDDAAAWSLAQALAPRWRQLLDELEPAWRETAAWRAPVLASLGRALATFGVLADAALAGPDNAPHEFDPHGQPSPR